MISFKHALIWSLMMTIGAIVMVALVSFASWENVFSKISWGFIRYVVGMWILAFTFAAACKIYELIQSRQQKVES